MTTVKKYNLEGEEMGEITIDPAFLEIKANGKMIKEYLVAMRTNARQWSASTKGRGEVKHTTKKPHRQKGTGRARQGSLVSPQYRGGGIVFGPKPKFQQHLRINKKERKASIRYLLAEKIRSQHLLVLEQTELEQPKTKIMVKFLAACGCDKRVLFLWEGNTKEVSIEDKSTAVSVSCHRHRHLAKSVRNLPKVQFRLAKNVNGYDLMLANYLVVTEEALNEMQQWLG
ncbi:MAG: 50S ribosomal protein L4 [Waddliaceae bacterium]